MLIDIILALGGGGGGGGKNPGVVFEGQNLNVFLPFQEKENVFLEKSKKRWTFGP